MHIDIYTSNDNIKDLLAFCHDMIEISYFPAYRRGAVEMLHEYHNEAAIRRDLAQGRVWCAWEDCKIVGTVTVSAGELSRMFVSPALRGQGLGAQLAREALAYAGGSGIKKLTAWSVPFSRGFYAKLGFVMLNADMIDFNGKREIPVPYLEMALWPAGAPDVTISEAVPADADELLSGQRAAFVEQCSIYDDWQIPPMTEKPKDLAAFLGSGGTVLKATCGGSIIGAVRGNVVEDVCYVGRLYVLPQWQGKAVARRLLAALEEKMQGCPVFSLYTGERSEKNLALYGLQGYALTGRKAPAKEPGSQGNYDMVWLEKPNPWPEIVGCARRFNAR